MIKTDLEHYIIKTLKLIQELIPAFKAIPDKNPNLQNTDITMHRSYIKFIKKPNIDTANRFIILAYTLNIPRRERNQRAPNPKDLLDRIEPIEKSIPKGQKRVEVKTGAQNPQEGVPQNWLNIFIEKIGNVNLKPKVSEVPLPIFS